MRYSPSELIDKLSIVQLKIERIGEPHLKKAYEEIGEAIQEYRDVGIKIKQEWIDELYQVNGKIWNYDFEIRDLIHKKIENINDKELERIGRNTLIITDLMRERVSLKNKIVKETGKGFIEIKVDHASA